MVVGLDHSLLEKKVMECARARAVPACRSLFADPKHVKRDEQKRLEKEAKAKEHAEQPANKQARRESEREKLRIAKRSLSDEVGLFSSDGLVWFQHRRWCSCLTLLDRC